MLDRREIEFPDKPCKMAEFYQNDLVYLTVARKNRQFGPIQVICPIFPLKLFFKFQGLQVIFCPSFKLNTSYKSLKPTPDLKGQKIYIQFKKCLKQPKGVPVDF